MPIFEFMALLAIYNKNMSFSFYFSSEFYCEKCNTPFWPLSETTVIKVGKVFAMKV